MLKSFEQKKGNKKIESEEATHVSISYSVLDYNFGPCMNNIKMRNSSNRDASLLKWWLFDIVCMIRTLYYFKTYYMGLPGNVSIKSLLIQPIPFPKALYTIYCVFFSLFVCSPAVTIALPFQICLLITFFDSSSVLDNVVVCIRKKKQKMKIIHVKFYLCSW